MIASAATSTMSIDRLSGSAPTRAPDIRNRAAAPMSAGTIGHVYRSPMDASVNAASSISPTGSSARQPRSARGRCFRVIALVLVAVVPRVVVAVTVEVNSIEDSRNGPRMSGLQRFDRAFREAPPRHLGADDERDRVHERGKDHRVGDGEHGWRIDDDPVEWAARQLPQESPHAL